MGDFRYYRPGSLQDLLRVKEELGGEGIVLAGGSNVMVTIEQGGLRGGTLLDIHDLADLKGIREENGVLSIGAAETMADLLASPLIAARLPMFAQMLAAFANPLVRRRATLGGNLADASPIGDSIPPLLCLRARLELASAQGRRQVALEEFFTGPGQKILKADEIILRVKVPVQEHGNGAFIKLGLRRGTSCSVSSVAVWLSSKEGRIEEALVACGGVAPTPRRAAHAEQALRGRAASEAVFREAAPALQEDIAPITDVRGSAEYRREVTAGLLVQALRRAAGLQQEVEA